MTKLLLLSFALCISQYCSIASAQSVALDLDEAVQRGLDHSASLALVKAQEKEAQAVARMAGAARGPVVNSLASYTRLSDNIPEISFSSDFLPASDESFTLAPVELNRIYSEVSMEQPLFSGLRLKNQSRAAGHNARAFGLEVDQRQAHVAFEVRQAYWQMFYALALEETLNSAADQVQAHVDNARRRQSAGLALENEVLAAQTRLSEIYLERVEAGNAVQLAQLSLSQLTGLALNTHIELISEPQAEPEPESFDDLLDTVLADQPGLQALSQQIEAFDARLKASRGAWFPAVALSGRYVYARPNQYFFIEQNRFNSTWETGVVLRWTLWDSNARSAEVQQAEAQLDAVQARYQAGREQLSVASMQRYLERERSSAAIEAAALNEQVAEESFRIVQQQYAEGTALASQVLDAEQALRTASVRRLQALTDLAIVDAALKEIKGKVW